MTKYQTGVHIQPSGRITVGEDVRGALQVQKGDYIDVTFPVFKEDTDKDTTTVTKKIKSKNRVRLTESEQDLLRLDELEEDESLPLKIIIENF